MKEVGIKTEEEEEKDQLTERGLWSSTLVEGNGKAGQAAPDSMMSCTHLERDPNKCQRWLENSRWVRMKREVGREREKQREIQKVSPMTSMCGNPSRPLRSLFSAARQGLLGLTSHVHVGKRRPTSSSSSSGISPLQRFNQPDRFSRGRFTWVWDPHLEPGIIQHEGSGGMDSMERLSSGSE